jgi:hypothetical protein
VTGLNPLRRKPIDLDRRRWRVLGRLVALHGRLALPVARVGRELGAALTGRRQAPPPDWYVRGLHGVLLLPLRGLLTVARRLF